MKLSVFNPVLYDMDLKSAMAYLTSMGVNSMELGVGGYPGTTHIDAKELIKDKRKIENLKNLLNEFGMEICALSTHGNALHPNKKIAQSFHNDFTATCMLADELNVKIVITFSGCPGDSDSSQYPNWVVCPWPDDFKSILDYQWEKLIEYWDNASRIAENCNVEKIAFEMHPGFCVYNPETLLRLRSAVGNIIGANYDPSHLIWQGIDVKLALKYLLDKKAVYHFHAKDTLIDTTNTKLNGVLDTKHYTDEINRSWIFRTVGYGQDENVWKDMMSILNMYEYNGAVSIEHEDSLMTSKEGLEKAISFLKRIMINNSKPKNIGWA